MNGMSCTGNWENPVNVYVVTPAVGNNEGKHRQRKADETDGGEASSERLTYLHERGQAVGKYLGGRYQCQSSWMRFLRIFPVIPHKCHHDGTFNLDPRWLLPLAYPGLVHICLKAINKSNSELVLKRENGLNNNLKWSIRAYTWTL